MMTAMLIPSNTLSLEFDYINYKGEVSHLRARVGDVFYGTAEPWHTSSTWLMNAFDLDKQEARVFEMHSMSNVVALDPRYGQLYNPHSPVVETMKRKS